MENSDKMILTAVKAVILDKNRFLVTHHSIKGRELWDLPGGKMDFGETPKETLVREIKEELGLHVEPLKCLGAWSFFRIKDGNQVVCITYVCRIVGENTLDMSQNPSEAEKNEYLDHRWVTKDEFLSGDYDPNDKSLTDLLGESDL